MIWGRMKLAISKAIEKPHERAVRYVKGRSLTYLERPALVELAEAVIAIERRRVPGMIVEAGTALGGSAIVIAAAKKADRPLECYDVFGMIPPPSDRDDRDVHERYEVIARGDSKGIGEGRYYGYVDDLIDKVAASFADSGFPISGHQVRLIKGLYEETMDFEGPIALAHIDCDWYDSVTVCLERIAPRVAAGGLLIIDDYDAWSGCREAVDDYFREKNGWAFRHNSRLHIERNP